MSRVSCSCCNASHDVRQMTSCNQCNSYICEKCANENNNVCDACYDMGGDVPD